MCGFLFLCIGFIKHGSHRSQPKNEAISVAATDCAAVLQIRQRLCLIPHQAGRRWEVQVPNLIQSCDEITSVDERGLSVWSLTTERTNDAWSWSTFFEPRPSVSVLGGRESKWDDLKCRLAWFWLSWPHFPSRKVVFQHRSTPLKSKSGQSIPPVGVYDGFMMVYALISVWNQEPGKELRKSPGVSTGGWFTEAMAPKMVVPRSWMCQVRHSNNSTDGGGARNQWLVEVTSGSFFNNPKSTVALIKCRICRTSSAKSVSRASSLSHTHDGSMVLVYMLIFLGCFCWWDPWHTIFFAAPTMYPSWDTVHQNGPMSHPRTCCFEKRLVPGW